tara:strand:- start:290 stop:448 length:159 start_codon:yes stop_codon:yes gene_type:complete
MISELSHIIAQQQSWIVKMLDNLFCVVFSKRGISDILFCGFHDCSGKRDQMV